MLADIEVAQSLQAQKAEEEEEEEVAHPLDQDYALLCCQLSLLDPSSREHQVLGSPPAHRDPEHCGEPSRCHLLGGDTAGWLPCGDTVSLPPFPAADPKLRGADREPGPHPQHLGGGPRRGGEKKELQVPSWGPCPCDWARSSGGVSGAGAAPCPLPWPALSSTSLQDKSFQAHDHLEHRRLLWHGTNVAVIAAILRNGLRIMPHSGGRVGRGIYFASENSKSACYGEHARLVGTSVGLEQTQIPVPYTGLSPFRAR